MTLHLSSWLSIKLVLLGLLLQATSPGCLLSSEGRPELLHGPRPALGATHGGHTSPQSGLRSPRHGHCSAGLSLGQPYSDPSQVTPQNSAAEGQGRQWGATNCTPRMGGAVVGAREKHHELHPQDGKSGGGETIEQNVVSAGESPRLLINLPAAH